MAKRRQGAESSINKLLSDTEPLDVAEQDHVVASLEAKQREQERLGCGLLTTLIGFLALMHAYLAGKQLLQPWSMRQAAHFHGVFPFWLVSLGDLLSAFAYASSAVLLYQQSNAIGQQVSKRNSIGCTSAACCFWLVSLFRAADVSGEGHKSILKHAWMPFSPVGVLLLIHYVLHMFSSSRRDLRNLKSKMYNFKKA